MGVILLCKFDQHEWEYKGGGSITKCPTCMKNVNVKKARLLYLQGHPEPGTEAMQEQFASHFGPSGLAQEGKIEVQEVSVTVPDGLKVEQKIPEKEEKGKTVKQVTIPIKTVEVICETPFNLLANLTGEDEMRLSVSERDSMTPLVKQLLEQHMGPWMSQYSTEIALAIVVGMIGMRRMSIYSKMKKKQKAQQNVQQNIQPGEKPDWAVDDKRR